MYIKDRRKFERFENLLILYRSKAGMDQFQSRENDQSQRRTEGVLGKDL